MNENQYIYEFSLKRERVFKFAEKPATLYSARTVYDFLKSIGMHEEETERVVVLMLDIKNKLRGYSVVAQGSVESVHIKMREIFRPAILNGASGIIISHNHPTGSGTPSREDDAFLKASVKVSKLLSIPLIDSVIVGVDDYYSYAERNSPFLTPPHKYKEVRI